VTRRTFLLNSIATVYRPHLEWLAIAISGGIEQQNWPAAESAVSVGSLLKPFLALSYLASHNEAPIIECRGQAAGCWRPRGHGRQDLASALANSCNVYFLQLAQNVNRAALDLTCLSFGLSKPPRSWPATRLIGLGQGWPQTPVAVARAYAGLSRNGNTVHARLVLAGMRKCASCGTARAARISCYAKTGTAACSHARGGLGDGYVVAIYPVEQPRHVILLSKHNSTGAGAAADLKHLVASLS
jgi:cell division protein FtsI/penicillin-binding protein 2